MANISQVKMNRFQEAEDKRYNFEMKKLRAKHNNQVAKEAKANEAMLERMRDEYKVKIGNLRNELEQKLQEVRNRQGKQLKVEIGRAHV